MKKNPIATVPEKIINPAVKLLKNLSFKIMLSKKIKFKPCKFQQVLLHWI